MLSFLSQNMQSFSRVLLAILTVAQLAAAHFKIVSPTPRFNSTGLHELVHPCGGVPAVNRTLISVTGAWLNGTLGHPSAPANFSVFVGNSDPKSDADFTLIQSVTAYMGPWNATIDFSAIAGVKDAANATIQVSMKTDDGFLVQCADVTFKAAAVVPVSSVPVVVATSTTAADSGYVAPASDASRYVAPTSAPGKPATLYSGASNVAASAVVAAVVALMH
ncbi:hypothetical protein BC830DRAFT_550882 [Chytriomyces sp. MP71]|nr:hypothetical protein BC830DRAFT_550882 [Chytriomyces sp. MP71]